MYTVALQTRAVVSHKDAKCFTSELSTRLRCDNIFDDVVSEDERILKLSQQLAMLRASVQ